MEWKYNKVEFICSDQTEHSTNTTPDGYSLVSFLLKLKVTVAGI